MFRTHELALQTLALFADAAKFAKPTTDLWRFDELDHLVLAGLTLESMPRRAGLVPLYSREPHRCAAPDARDLFKMRNGLKLAHGDPLLPFQAERGRFRFHQRATPTGAKNGKYTSRNAYKSVQ
jgi:hypothetical protein